MSPETETRWRSTINDPPPEGVVVEVQNNGGAHLKRIGRLWFFPDASMYVYYTPEFWREIRARDQGGDPSDR